MTGTPKSNGSKSFSPWRDLISEQTQAPDCWLFSSISLHPNYIYIYISPFAFGLYPHCKSHRSICSLVTSRLFRFFLVPYQSQRYIYIYAHVWWLEPTSQVHAYFSGLNHVKCLFLWGLSALTTKGSVIPRTLGKLHGQCLGRRLSLRLAQADGADGEVGKLSNHSRGIE